MFTPSDSFEGFLEEDKQSSSAWLMTLSDLLSLMLAFFIMLYAMSTIQEGEWEELTKSFTRAFRSDLLLETSYVIKPLGVDSEKRLPARSLTYLENIIKEKINAIEILRDVVSVKREKKSLVLTLNAEALFEYDSDTLSYNKEPILYALGNHFHQLENRIDVISRFDPSWMTSIDYPSAWEVAMLRGMKVAEYLQKFGYGGRLDVLASPLLDKQGAKKNSPKSTNKPASLQRPSLIQISISQDRGKLLNLKKY